ncbi:hypothetical protein THASP1DRAFT_29885 [Thamnocephalis sphaerospora]|uniref:Myb-like domain-containing protein n=1 Tax=Thamnocephalis sphaerospora TaxID=78915 RepID=A0A4P9XS11_9FUNG|nr:hypothetical protein THASP1DRAFT_29885 [Thamnocephalis sphaerospora]|eukprot:RKP08311.1 hypothetical protein THASP1DRAFT_29885 [Thamnocephalis sphaerospora]
MSDLSPTASLQLMLPPSTIRSNASSRRDCMHAASGGIEDDAAHPPSSPSVSRVARKTSAPGSCTSERTRSAYGTYTPEPSSSRSDPLSGTEDVASTAADALTLLPSQPYSSPTSARRNTQRRGRWSFHEDEQLRAAVTRYGCDWEVVSAGIPGRGQTQCLKRWSQIGRAYERDLSGTRPLVPRLPLSSMSNSINMSTTTAHRPLLPAAAVPGPMARTSSPATAGISAGTEAIGATTCVRRSAHGAMPNSGGRSGGRARTHRHARTESVSDSNMDALVPPGLFSRADEYLAAQLKKMRQEDGTRRLTNAVPVAPAGTMAVASASPIGLDADNAAAAKLSMVNRSADVARTRKIAAANPPGSSTKRAALAPLALTQNMLTDAHLPRDANQAAKQAMPPTIKPSVTRSSSLPLAATARRHHPHHPPIGTFSRSSSGDVGLVASNGQTSRRTSASSRSTGPAPPSSSAAILGSHSSVSSRANSLPRLAPRPSATVTDDEDRENHSTAAIDLALPPPISRRAPTSSTDTFASAIMRREVSSRDVPYQRYLAAARQTASSPARPSAKRAKRVHDVRLRTEQHHAPTPMVLTADARISAIPSTPTAATRRRTLSNAQAHAAELRDMQQSSAMALSAVASESHVQAVDRRKRNLIEDVVDSDPATELDINMLADSLNMDPANFGAIEHALNDPSAVATATAVAANAAATAAAATATSSATTSAPELPNEDCMVVDGYVLDRETVYAAVADDLLSRSASQGGSVWDIMGRVVSTVMAAREARDRDRLKPMLPNLLPQATTTAVAPGDALNTAASTDMVAQLNLLATTLNFPATALSTNDGASAHDAMSFLGLDLSSLNAQSVFAGQLDDGSSAPIGTTAGAVAGASTSEMAELDATGIVVPGSAHLRARSCGDLMLTGSTGNPLPSQSTATGGLLAEASADNVLTSRALLDLLNAVPGIGANAGTALSVDTATAHSQMHHLHSDQIVSAPVLDEQGVSLFSDGPLQSPAAHPESNPFYLGDLDDIDGDLFNFLLKQPVLQDENAHGQDDALDSALGDGGDADSDDNDAFGQDDDDYEHDDARACVDTADEPLDEDEDTYVQPAAMHLQVRPGADDPENAEYLRFLESLMEPAEAAELAVDSPAPTSATSATAIAAVTPFDMCADPAALLADDADEDCEFTAEPAPLNEQNEEFRRDRSAIVSRREYQDLVMGTESDDESDEDALHQATAQLRPSRADGLLFTLEQMEMLRRQQECNLQLLLQTCTVERELRGDQNNAFLNHWRGQINALVSCRDQTHAALAQRDADEEEASDKAESSKTQQTSEAAASTNAYPSFHDIVGLDEAHEWVYTTNSICPRDEEFVRRMRRPVRRRRKVQLQMGNMDQFYWEQEELQPLELPKSLQLLNETFAEIFNYHLIPRIVCANTRARTSFFPAQDALLLIGLYAFGDDWHSIRSHLLPNMTAKQILTRFNNLKSRRYPSNPVKDWHLMRVKPLTLQEEEKLRKGVAHFGRKFKLLSARVLRDRPAAMLRQAWREMYSQHPFRTRTEDDDADTNEAGASISTFVTAT